MTAAASMFGYLGRSFLLLLQWLGDATKLSASSLVLLFARPWQGKHFVLQLYALGVGSFVIIAITGAFTGMVLSLQGYYTLTKFGSESLLGSAVALSIIRELGPVLGALMVVGRAGSSITAEIGIMRVTEQVDALEMMAVNPRARIILPRIVATTLAVPVLVAFFDVIGIACGYELAIHLLERQFRLLHRRDGGQGDDARHELRLDQGRVLRLHHRRHQHLYRLPRHPNHRGRGQGDDAGRRRRLGQRADPRLHPDILLFVSVTHEFFVQTH